MQKLWILLLIPILFSCKRPQEFSVNSPDGRIGLYFKLVDGKPFYHVVGDGQTLISPSSLGFTLKEKPLSSRFVISDVLETAGDETWVPPCGTDSCIRNNYREMTVTLREDTTHGRRLQFVARAYNDGVAFRFVFTEDFAQDSLLILSENTEFRFPQNDSAWWIPPDEFAYESLYRNTPLMQVDAAHTPVTIGRGPYLCIHEAALTDYSEMYLRRDKNDSLPRFSSALWPWPDGVCCRNTAPFKTPWRCIIIVREAGRLLESHLIQNLNEPCAIRDVSWIKPLKFVGIWWDLHLGKQSWKEGPQHGATTENSKRYIDFAERHGIDGFLAEGWNKGWETWAAGLTPMQDFCRPADDFDLDAVVQYARSKGVAFVSHHETGGNIPVYEQQMDSAMALCQRLGIRYLKTGYAGPILPAGCHHHGQYMVRHFQKVVETAARYGICIDAHESIKPTGLDRTWPNLLTQEAARGNEWNATYKATPPYHATILPFTRFVAGPYDYTPGIFGINHSPEKNKRLYCTLSYQLALYVAFYSPMMMVSDRIEAYEGHPAFRFPEAVPCSWDETKAIAAVPGDLVCVARRSDRTWFVGSMTDEHQRLLRIPLSFLNPGETYVAEIFGDSLTTDWKQRPQAVECGSYLVSSKDTILAALAKAGGHAVILRPFGAQEKSSLRPIAFYNQGAAAKMKVFAQQETFGNRRVAHLALGCQLKLETAYSERYPASGPDALTDGERAELNYAAGGWQGFEGCDLKAVIDLGKPKSIRRISAGFLGSPNDWIFLPLTVECSISEDGQTYRLLGSWQNPRSWRDHADLIEIVNVPFDGSGSRARYIRIVAKSQKQCPEGHTGKGGKAWLFCDEIVVE
jgi:alpha-glucosidase